MLPRICLTTNSNVLLLGLAFMLIFTAFTTTTLVQQTLIDLLKSHKTFRADGFISLGITYLTMLITCWLAPSIVSALGVVPSMVTSSIFFLFYVAVFIDLRVTSLYVAAALLGIAASVLWTAQGAYITAISTQTSTNKNIGVFWSLFQGNQFTGNLILFILLQHANFEDIYRTLFISLCSIALFGILLLSLLLLPSLRSLCPRPDPTNLVDILHLFFDRNILLISPSSLFSGIILAFISGILPTCITRTLFFNEFGKTIISLTAISLGVGEIVGGIASSSRLLTSPFGRVSPFFLGYLLNTVSFYVIYTSLPSVTTQQPSIDTSILILYFGSHAYILLIIVGFLLGLSDALISTQIMALLTDYFSHRSSSAYAIFKFVQSSGSALAFFTSSHFTLEYLLLLYFVAQTIALFCFYLAEIRLTSLTM